MKSLIGMFSLLAILSTVLITGCKKEETQEPDQQTTETVDAWLFNSSDGSFVKKTIDVNDMQSNFDIKERSQNNSAHTHGSYSNPGTSFTWSGTQNNGGTHGSATVTVKWFNPAQPVVLTLETECVQVEGNEAVYGGTITEALNVPEGLEFLFPVGDRLYFKVIDNGQGNNAPPDQYSNIFITTNASFCGDLPPSDLFWSFFGYSNVVAPGSVKVN